MAREQEGLPGIPQAAKRTVIRALEDLCIERDRMCGQRTAINDEIGAISDKIQEELVERDLQVYTYQDDSGVLQDVDRVEKLRKKKSANNPKPKGKGGAGKKSDEAAA